MPKFDSPKSYLETLNEEAHQESNDIIEHLEKELYDLRKAVWNHKRFVDKAAGQLISEMSMKDAKAVTAEIDRLMGDWSPEKDIGENNSGDNPAERN